MDNIKTNLSIIHQRMEAACRKANHDVDDVRLLLATKTVPAERITFALECGETLIGENKVQELKEKEETLHPYNYESHFIGHLQTNKIKDVPLSLAREFIPTVTIGMNRKADIASDTCR